MQLSHNLSFVWHNTFCYKRKKETLKKGSFETPIIVTLLLVLCNNNKKDTKILGVVKCCKTKIYTDMTSYTFKESERKC